MSLPYRTEPAPDAKPCPFCGSSAVWGFINITGTFSSGMERPDITLGCTLEGIWLPSQKTEQWERGKGTYSIEHRARIKLLAIWNRRS